MYIDFVSEENKKYYISYWLLLITFLVALMIVVGGLTRLTDSGLSITKWDLFIGIIPPLTKDDWINSFNLYKKIPEFKLENYQMTLDQFKVIFWWEYIHRLLGRLIGLLYIIPLFFFHYKKILNKEDLKNFYFIFALILFQGVVGWYMVKSGLVERTDVSHYRLSLHLTLAFIIYILILWNYFKSLNLYRKKNNLYLPLYLYSLLLFLILLQISIGAFVSGLDAGQIYNSWPLMNANYFPDDSKLIDLFSLDVFNKPSLVQFVHRNLAYLIFLIFLIIVAITYKNSNFLYLRKTTFFVFLILLLQILIGILTVKHGAQIFLASIHQIGSIFLVTATLLLIFKNSNSS